MKNYKRVVEQLFYTDNVDKYGKVLDLYPCASTPKWNKGSEYLPAELVNKFLEIEMDYITDVNPNGSVTNIIIDYSKMVKDYDLVEWFLSHGVWTSSFAVENGNDYEDFAYEICNEWLIRLGAGLTPMETTTEMINFMLKHKNR